ncbi:hypothetical protein IU483_31790 [Streptomyces gardneri]|nr:hypothetical protein [Streptomyces gardneri]
MEQMYFVSPLPFADGAAHTEKDSPSGEEVQALEWASSAIRFMPDFPV